MQCEDFFHSMRLFRIYEQTPRHRPLMVAVMCGNEIVAHLLAVVSYRWTLLPPYLYMHCRVIGEGDYSCEEYARQEELFGLMLNTLDPQAAPQGALRGVQQPLAKNVRL